MKTRAKQNTLYARPKESDGETTAKKEVDETQDDEHSFKCDKCKNVVDGLIQCESWFCCTCGNYPCQAIAIVSACKSLH